MSICVNGMEYSPDPAERPYGSLSDEILLAAIDVAGLVMQATFYDDEPDDAPPPWWSYDAASNALDSMEEELAIRQGEWPPHTCTSSRLRLVGKSSQKCEACREEADD